MAMPTFDIAIGSVKGLIQALKPDCSFCNRTVTK